MRTAANAITIGLMSLGTGLVWQPATAHADETQTVNVNQTARRSVGRCVYETRLEGHYQTVGSTDRAVPVREAVIAVTTRLDCRGAPPKLAMRQIYFAETTEDALLGRLAEVTRVENPGSNGACAFAPTLRRDGQQLLVTDVVATCDAPRQGASVSVSARTRRR